MKMSHLFALCKFLMLSFSGNIQCKQSIHIFVSAFSTANKWFSLFMNTTGSRLINYLLLSSLPYHRRMLFRRKDKMFVFFPCVYVNLNSVHEQKMSTVRVEWNRVTDICIFAVVLQRVTQSSTSIRVEWSRVIATKSNQPASYRINNVPVVTGLVSVVVRAWNKLDTAFRNETNV